MAPLPGKNEMIMRTVSMVLLLAGWITLNIVIGTALENLGTSVALISGPIVMSVLIVFSQKAEYDFVEEKRNILLLSSLLIGIIIVVAIGYSTISDEVNEIVWMFLVPVIVSLFALINSWHYTLTIYKNQMNMHIGFYVLFMVLFIAFSIDALGLLILAPTIIATVGIVLNQYAVKALLKKKLLKLIA